MTTWMDHKSNMLTEMSHKEKYFLISIFCGLERNKNPSSLIQGPDWWLPEIQGWRLDRSGEGGQKVKKKKVSFLPYVQK